MLCEEFRIQAQRTEQSRKVSETPVCQLKFRSAVTTAMGSPFSFVVVVFTVRRVGLHCTSGMLTSADQVKYMMYAEMQEDCNSNTQY